jgi:hypothetical protein
VGPSRLERLALQEQGHKSQSNGRGRRQHTELRPCYGANFCPSQAQVSKSAHLLNLDALLLHRRHNRNDERVPLPRAPRRAHEPIGVPQAIRLHDDCLAFCPEGELEARVVAHLMRVGDSGDSAVRVYRLEARVVARSLIWDQGSVGLRSHLAQGIDPQSGAGGQVTPQIIASWHADSSRPCIQRFGLQGWTSQYRGFEGLECCKVWG